MSVGRPDDGVTVRLKPDTTYDQGRLTLDAPDDHGRLTPDAPDDHGRLTPDAPYDHGRLTPDAPYDHGRLTPDAPYDHGRLTPDAPYDHGRLTPDAPDDHGRLTPDAPDEHGRLTLDAPDDHGRLTPDAPDEHGRLTLDAPDDHGRLTPDAPDEHGRLTLDAPDDHGRLTPDAPDDHGRLTPDAPDDHGRLTPDAPDDHGRLTLDTPDDHGRLTPDAPDDHGRLTPDAPDDHGRLTLDTPDDHGRLTPDAPDQTASGMVRLKPALTFDCLPSDSVPYVVSGFSRTVNVVSGFSRTVSRTVIGWAAIALILIGMLAGQAAAQLPLEPLKDSGQGVTAAYEGWFKNPDGTFTLLIGYLNRNQKQTLDIPIGPNNRIEPGGPDQGQPTHFLPRRQWGVFTVTVPANFAERTLAWTLTVNGKTTVVPMGLNPLYEVEPFKDVANNNTPPILRFEQGGSPFQGPPRRIVATLGTTLPQPVTLSLYATDDGVVTPDRRASDSPVTVTWSMFRGPGVVTFADVEPSIDKSTGKATTTATFSAPGEYVLRMQANDVSGEGGGGFQCCWTNVHVKVVVKER